MPISRRTILRLLAGSAAVPAAFGRADSNIWQRRYRASATVTLLSVPVFSRQDVGSGFAVIEESGQTIAIQFGAGSFPETAHGLNRLGFIHEQLVERVPGEPSECTYFGFMTTSAEKGIDEARKAMESVVPTIPYAAAEGHGRDGLFKSKLDRITLPSNVTWRDYPQLTARVKSAVSASAESQNVEKRMDSGAAAPATFLYSVRKALTDPGHRTSRWLTYNSRDFLMRTDKQRDAVMGAKFAARGLTRNADSVWCLNATLKERTTGQVTPFKVYFEAGLEHLPPLRFEYQAKSFLKLAFEYDPAASGSLIGFCLSKKENA